MRGQKLSEGDEVEHLDGPKPTIGKKRKADENVKSEIKNRQQIHKVRKIEEKKKERQNWQKNKHKKRTGGKGGKGGRKK